MLWLLIKQQNVCVCVLFFFFKWSCLASRDISCRYSKQKCKCKRKKWHWRCSIIGYFSHLTPTVVWHNVPALTTITSTVTDGVVWSWACYHYSREAKFFKAFYCLILFVSPRKSRLVYSEMNNSKKWIIIVFAVYLLTICLDLFIYFFPKLWGKDGTYSSVGRGRKSSLSHFQIRRLFLTASSWHYGGDDLFFFPIWGISHDSRFREVEMGTWGSRVNNAHLRHDTSRTISWHVESEIQKKKKVWSGGRARRRKGR